MNTEENKKTRLDMMVDMETVSLKENAGILSLALVPFNRDGSVNDLVPFYLAVDLTSCFMSGMDMTGCQEWWMKQDPKAIAEIVKAEKMSIGTVINMSHTYLSNLAEQYELVMWSRGMDFDFPKLEWCFRKFVEKEPPYAYYNKRDVRTWVKELGVDESQIEFEGTKHNALDDCKHQIKLVQAAMHTGTTPVIITPTYK